MNDARSPVDLSALTRKPRSGLEPPSGFRRWKWRLVPLGVLVVFVAVMLSSLRDLFEREVSVTVERPRALDARAQAAVAASGTALFQAAGWAEPEPFASEVSALRSGVIDELLVVPAQRVETGQVVARLIREDAELHVDAAHATVERAEAEVARQTTELALAEESFREALSVREDEEVALAESAGRIAALASTRQALVQGSARVRIAKDEWVVQQELAERGAAGLRQLDLAEARVEEAEGALAELEAKVALAEADAAVAEARVRRARREREIRLQDRLRRDLARDQLPIVQASLAAAKVALAEAELALARCEVRALTSGFVLALHALPGSALVSATGTPILTLYDPAHLRMRVDVLADDIAKVHVGQRAEVLTDARPDRPYSGKVLRITEMADIQKKTLQAHVAVEDGDEFLKPDLLGQVRFFASGEGDRSYGTGDDSSGTPSNRVLISARLLDAQSRVWVVIEGRARQRKVETGSRQGDWVEILSGLDLSSKLVDAGRERLEDGTKVVIASTEEHSP